LTRTVGKPRVAQPADQFVHERIFGAAQCGKFDPRRGEKFGRIGRAGMRRIENDRCPPFGGSTISNGGDSSPSSWVIVERRPSNPLVPGHVILARKRSFYENALSIITAVLPSEKQAKSLNLLEEVL